VQNATHRLTCCSTLVARADLHTALGSRDIIGQAKGILMERHRVAAEAAFG
jgi:AmiR/NasT family two-component response regulator